MTNYNNDEIMASLGRELMDALAEQRRIGTPDINTAMLLLDSVDKLLGEDAPNEEEDDYQPEDDRDDDNFGIRFANPGSALRAATEDNPRNLPCPRCEEENVLTPEDRAQGYVCDTCADRAESGHDL